MVGFIKNLKVGRRLGLAFAVVLVLTAGLTITGIRRLTELDGIITNITQETWPRTEAANEIISQANAIGLETYDLTQSTDPAEMRDLEQQIDEAGTVIRDTLRSLQDVRSEDGERLLGEIARARDAYDASYGKLRGLVEAGDLAGAQALMEAETRPRLDRLRSTVKSLVELEGSVMEANEATARASADSGIRLLILLSLLALLGGVVLSWAIARSITGPLDRAVWLMGQIGNGHLSERVELDRRDQLGELIAVMNQFASDLQVHVIGVLDRLAHGDTGVELIRKDDGDEISPVLFQLRDSLSALVRESGALAEAALAGRLAERADAGVLEGGYREVVDGFNATLDAIATPINEASEVLERVAARDLTARMEGEYRGDYAVIKRSLNQAMDNLEEALAEVSMAAGQVASAANEISGGSQSLAEGASEQASSLEEISSSLQELASMAGQNAGNAREARSLTESAGASTEGGAEAMTRLSDTVRRIKESSDATGRIVKTIDEIAFQTNLLALNAAVEAARAGEAGKGFAVVAEEVRNLAMRSAEAAKETAALIEQSVESSEEGVAVQAEVVAKLDEIRTGVGRVREVMAEIAAASEQQTDGVGEINGAVEEMNAVTQRSAASSEESASAAEELSGQAERMAELVGRFTLSADRTSAVAGHAPSAGRAKGHASAGGHAANGHNGHGRGNGHGNGNGHNGNGHNGSGRNGHGGAALGGAPGSAPAAGRLSPSELIPLDPPEDDDDRLSRF